MNPPPEDRIAHGLAGLPEAGAVILVTLEPADEARDRAERALRVARQLAAARAHVVLAGIGGAGVVLDGVMKVTGPGLEAVFRGEASLAGIAVTGGDGAPVYLPSGVTEAGRAPKRTAAARRAARLAAVLRKGRATLVLLLEGDVAAAAGVAELADLVLRSDASPPAASEARDTDTRVHERARVRTAKKRGRWRRHRKRGETAVARAVAAVTLVAAAVGGWWITMAVFGPEQPATTELAPRAAGAETTAASAASPPGGGSRGAPADSARAARPPTGSQPPPSPEGRPAARTAAKRPPDVRIVDRAPALPYSVLIASYSARSDAVSRARRWAASDDVLYLVAPTPVQGRVYYRLFAGAEASRDAASRLMSRLVRRGRKERSNSWDVRPVSLAFRLAVRDERGAALARADSLRARGVSAYVVPAASAADTVWQVYAGAFESAGAGAVLARSLEASGQEAKLVTRRGTRGR